MCIFLMYISLRQEGIKVILPYTNISVFLISIGRGGQKFIEFSFDFCPLRMRFLRMLAFDETVNDVTIIMIGYSLRYIMCTSTIIYNQHGLHYWLRLCLIQVNVVMCNVVEFVPHKDARDNAKSIACLRSAIWKHHKQYPIFKLV